MNSLPLNCRLETIDSPQPFLEAAAFIGARLCRDAIWSENRCNWTGPATIQLTNGRCAVAIRSCGPELFGGTTGIALFLARLSVATQERIFRLTAEAALRQALSRLDDFPNNLRIGFYKGLIGVAYTLTELYELLDIPKFAPMALLLLEEVEKEQPTRNKIDVLSGSAGAITPLLRMHGKLSQDLPLELAIKQGEKLLDCRSNASGFARGVEGIVWALSELGHSTGMDHFRQAAAQLAVHPAGDSSDESQTGWADGASGIGMSLLRRYEIYGEQARLDEARLLVERIARRLSAVSFDLGGTNYSLANGVAGEAEFLLDASRILNDVSYTQPAERVGRVGIECFRKEDLPWPCGGPDETESPGLMNGLAGIGHFYLRLFDQQGHSSLLLVQPGQDSRTTLPDGI
jgi:lantibiotic modifying enzyme